MRSHWRKLNISKRRKRAKIRIGDIKSIDITDHRIGRINQATMKMDIDTKGGDDQERGMIMIKSKEGIDTGAIVRGLDATALSPSMKNRVREPNVFRISLHQVFQTKI